MNRHFFFAIIFLLGGAFSAAAENKPLTVDQAKRFVATLPAVNALGADFEKEGKIEQLKIENKPVPGKDFVPYSNAVTILSEKHPADLKRLESSIKPQGFKAAEWGHVGDRVMIAYLALKMGRE